MLVVPADADRCVCGKPIAQRLGVDYLTDTQAVETVYLCLACFRKVATCSTCSHFVYHTGNLTVGMCRCLPEPRRVRDSLMEQEESYWCGQWSQGDLILEES